MPMWLQFLYRARWPLAVLLVLAMGLFAWYAVPKKQVLSAGYSGVAYYRGFGLTNGGGFFGKRFYAADFSFEHEWDYWYTKYDVYYRGGDRAYFKGYYKNGAIAYEGECSITLSPQGHPSQLDLMGGSWAKHYKPDGSLGSEVFDGTGLHMEWTQDGQIISEVSVKDGLSLYRTWWYPSAQQRMHLPFVDGIPHGESRHYWPDGRLSFKAAYEHGRPVGTWISYNEDGSVEKEIVHAAP